MCGILQAMANHTISIIVHDIRSTHNVGSLMRTAEGLGIDHIYFTGYSPYPIQDGDTRLPHLARKLDAQIHKTALGAEHMVAWSYHDNLAQLIDQLKADGIRLCALEQADQSIPLHTYHTDQPIALLLGREVEGIEPEILALVDDIIEIPMFGKKESFNVVQAAAMTLFQFRFHAG